MSTPKCPSCTEPVRIYPIGNSSTLMYCQSYYDVDGTYHNHDSNRRTAEFKCANGHYWSEDLPCPKCPTCRWPDV